MTREEAIENLNGLTKNINGELVDTYLIGNLIDAIFDDLNEQICKNCKYYDNELHCCDNEENLHMLGFTLTEIEETFCCNRFIEKDKK